MKMSVRMKRPIQSKHTIVCLSLVLCLFLGVVFWELYILNKSTEDQYTTGPYRAQTADIKHVPLQVLDVIHKLKDAGYSVIWPGINKTLSRQNNIYFFVLRNSSEKDSTWNGLKLGESCGKLLTADDELIKLSKQANRSQLTDITTSLSGRVVIHVDEVRVQIVSLYYRTHADDHRTHADDHRTRADDHNQLELFWFTSLRKECASGTSWKFPDHSGIIPRFETEPYELYAGEDYVSVLRPKEPESLVFSVRNSDVMACDRSKAEGFKHHYPPRVTPLYRRFLLDWNESLEIGQRVLNSLNVPFFISSGTHLGWFRQCGSIPFSNDIDFGIFIQHHNKHIVDSFEKEGMLIKHIYGRLNDSYEMAFIDRNKEVHITFFYEEADHVWYGITQELTAYKYKFVHEKFTLCWTDLNGLLVRAPCPSLRYVTTDYGIKWSVPDASFDKLRDSPNMQANGQWPVDEWDEVMVINDVPEGAR